MNDKKPCYHVLIVDDQRDIRRVLRASLETSDMNIEVSDVPSGEEAILVSLRQPVSLLVVDMDLPGITGLELKSQAEILNPSVKIIMITGMTDPDVLDEIERAKPDAFFQKPMSLYEFLDTVQELLSISVGTTGELSPEDKFNEQPPPQNLSERLANLRQDTNATCVILLDDCGQYLAQAGDLPREMDESAIISELLSTFSVSTRVSSLLGRKIPKDLLEYWGENYVFFLSHLDRSMGLLLVVKYFQVDDDRLMKSRRALSSAVEDLTSILIDMGVTSGQVDTDIAAITLEKPIEEQDTRDSRVLPELDAVFSNELREQIETESVDDFWADAMEESTGETFRTDVISYEQARRLGFVPDEEKKET